MSRNVLAPIGNHFNSLVSWANKTMDDCWVPAWNKQFAAKPKWFMEVGKSNAYTKDSDYVLEVNIPGVTEEEISLTHKAGTLQLAVTQAKTKEEKDRNYEYQEYSSHSFSRVFPLPDNVEAAVEPMAELKDGVLTIRFRLTPQPAKDEPKKIAVKKLD